MATIGEWIRDFKRLKKWDRFNISLAIFSLIIGFGFGYLVFEVNILSPQNMTGNYCVNCLKVSQIFESKIISNNLNQGLTTTIILTNQGELGKFNYKNILVILPNNQKAFIPIFYLNNAIEIAYCTPELTHCNIRPDYVLTNTQINDFDFINYSLKYLCVNLSKNPKNCPIINQNWTELGVCQILFLKNLTESDDLILFSNLNLDKDCKM